MPELAEVETIVGDLRKVLTGQALRGFSTELASAIWPNLRAFSKIKGKAVKEVKRRGKFLIFFLEQDSVVAIHLRMSGRLFLRKISDDKVPFERHCFIFSDTSLRFSDQRKFGRIWFSDLRNYEKVSGIAKLGIEPLQPDFTCERFIGMVNDRNTTIKKLLLDQTVISGIGNIYADESCFFAGIRPDRAVKNISKKDLKKIHEGIGMVLKKAINNRGTSMADFLDPFGYKGHNQRSLNVYGREGLPCRNCGEILKKIRHAGRGTVYCGRCQS